MWLLRLAKFAAGTNHVYQILISIVMIATLFSKKGKKHG